MEVLEEAGVWARIEQSLGVKELPVGDGKLRIEFFLMDFQSEAKTKEKRSPKWLSLPEAIDKATFKETKELLTQIQTQDSPQPPKAP